MVGEGLKVGRSRFHEMEQALDCFGIGYVRQLSGLGSAGTPSGVVSKGGCFQSFRELLLQVGWGVFDPTRFVPE